MNAADLVNLGLVSFSQGEVSAALNFWLQAEKISDDPLIEMNIGFAYNHMGQFDKGIYHIERAYKANPDRKEIKIAMGDSLIRHGRWLEAWEIYNPSAMPKNLDIPVRQWNGTESLSSKEVLIVLDGGYGDSIMFARYLSKFWELGASPSILNSPALVPLFFDQPSLATINQSDMRKFDFWVSQFDIPKIFQITPENLYAPQSYLIADGTKRLERLNDKPHVGICWTSTEKGHHYRFRSLQGNDALSIIESSAHIQWVSLQYEWPCPPQVLDAKINSWMDTANIISQLDLVVSIDTSIIHLAGALGQDAWVMLGGFVDGKFGKEGEDCPWYPSVRCFRNGEFGFRNTISNMISELGKFQPKKENKICHDATL